MVEISGKQYPIKLIFSHDFDFMIPPYQRPYAWTPEQAGELLADVDGFREEQNSEGEKEPYFLGSIVLIKKEGEAHAEVIDGQQRLITLTLLLAVLRDLCPAKSQGSLGKYINEPGDEVEQRDPKPRLTLKERDREFFHNYVQTDEQTAQLAALPDDGLTEPQVNLRDNARLFHDELANRDEEAAFSLAQYVVQHCYLVAVSTPSLRSAYRIFSVLNDRGLDLLPTDILKADIIGEMPEADRERCMQKWEDAEEWLGRERFNILFGHVRMIYQRAKSRKTLLEAFREHVLKAEADRKQLVEKVLLPYAAAMQTVTKVSYESAHGAEAVNEALKWLNRIDNSDWVPPAMAYLHRHKNDSKALARFFKALERLAASMFIRRANVNERIARYGELLVAIDQGTNLYGENSILMLMPQEKNQTLEHLDGEIYTGHAGVRKYVMLRLDAFRSDRAAVYNHNILTVEHVLPQTLSPNSQWTKDWAEPEREYWVHRLGNLVLLSRKKNSQARNWDFDKKKEQYFSPRGGTNSFALTNEVLDKDHWTPTVVKERQQAMIETLRNGWQL